MPPRDRYDLKAIRNQIKKRLHKDRDPTEFRPAKAEDGKVYKYRFIVLPPFSEGDIIEGDSKAENTMEQFFITDGSHYMEGKKLGCPRAINDDSCPLCDYGFELMGETDDKKQRSEIAKRLLSTIYYKCNIYFWPHKNNPTPDELVGKVFWYNSPKTVFDKFWDCLCRDDDGGDPHDREAFGVFYDELAAYVFQLEVKQKGLGNNYENSKFLAASGTLPIARNDNKPDTKRIAEILAQRHDLYAKRPDVELDKIQALTDSLAGKEPEDGGGFDKDETKSQGKASSKKGNKKDSKKEEKPDEAPLEEDSIDEGAEQEAISGEAPLEEDSIDEGGADVSADEPGDEIVEDSDGSGDSDDDEVNQLLEQLTDGDDF